MKKGIFVLSMLLGGWMLGSATEAVACESVGPNKHVGGITAINMDIGTFTIQDAETGHLISFEANSKILTDLNVKDRVLVSYKDEEDKLIAMDVRS